MTAEQIELLENIRIKLEEEDAEVLNLHSKEMLGLIIPLYGVWRGGEQIVIDN